MSKKYFVLSTEAFGKRQWLAGVMPSPSMPSTLTCLSDEIFSALDFVTAADAQGCLTDLGLTGFEVVSCEFDMSASLKKGVKKSMEKAKTRRRA